MGRSRPRTCSVRGRRMNTRRLPHARVTIPPESLTRVRTMAPAREECRSEEIPVWLVDARARATSEAKPSDGGTVLTRPRSPRPWTTAVCFLVGFVFFGLALLVPTLMPARLSRAHLPMNRASTSASTSGPPPAAPPKASSVAVPQPSVAPTPAPPKSTGAQPFRRRKKAPTPTAPQPAEVDTASLLETALRR
jgi:hypothetical protein